MAKVKLNPALQQVRGQLAGFVYRVRYGEQTISKLPDMSKVDGARRRWSIASGSGGRWRMRGPHWRMKRCAPCM